jgi:hypothetical protein
MLPIIKIMCYAIYIFDDYSVDITFKSQIFRNDNLILYRGTNMNEE